ncbi:hypothetical protein ACFYT4_16185 [Streptomyces sp. NPDC004609]|uniref:hypothetical protein n=1 Tax=Streptomyces sp. NPDC004609 TaxID=3364704 RepID=UPI0036913E3E
MRVHRIAAIAGDGIGRETLPAAARVPDALAGPHGFTLDWTEHPWGDVGGALTTNEVCEALIEVLAAPAAGS